MPDGRVTSGGDHELRRLSELEMFVGWRWNHARRGVFGGMDGGARETELWSLAYRPRRL